MYGIRDIEGVTLCAALYTNCPRRFSDLSALFSHSDPRVPVRISEYREEGSREITETDGDETSLTLCVGTVARLVTYKRVYKKSEVGWLQTSNTVCMGD